MPAPGGMGGQSELWAGAFGCGLGGLGRPVCLLRRAAFCAFPRCENQDVSYSSEDLTVKTVCRLPMMKEMLKRFQGEQFQGAGARRRNERGLQREEGAERAANRRAKRTVNNHLGMKGYTLP